MAQRPEFQPYSVIKDGNMALTLISSITIIQKVSMFSYSYSWAGTAPVGSIIVQVSNDYSQNADGTVRNAGTWNTLPLSNPTNVSGNSGNGQIDIDQCGAFAVRTVYTPASGTGVIQAIIAGKVS